MSPGKNWGPEKVESALRAIGFPLPQSATAKQRFEAITDFQRGFAFWKLVEDGWAGERTSRALNYCLTHNGLASPHFKFREFASKGTQDTTIKVRRALLRGLEELRDEVGPIGILSGYRDPQHNSAVGGASNSQHLYGNAMDPTKGISLSKAKAVQRFSGIGIDRSSGLARHLDVRHLGPSNATGGSVANPTIWYYA